ncbi:glutamate--tRNA ligase [Mammaliicoccus lentus]|jgi:nondiscriminating glutamyl-tRNA synthetase|uniref:glutamate--tRNA ligase n=1 Tax=Mammaliicoccus lentus TaxID=42858 RepID=UPI0003075646|nr:glutamate--tRNA ligase [Mammaliicoccus lentus]MBF0749851.1 glutamate--tRNA ligase [Mammaliicoccus lentus]MCD2477228.1 glutamate--tRNA ligase [Mammaliicoccus lentus]MCD2520871.1 glutamate--tRNA ligase [Mammaliicoccus lentus]MEB5686794.1 glutamate--tRNA ligase [Mammaliicoccus lentus]TFU57101.1 glutamate--tRNA ligase [Mammaliicoccus lentus]
MSNKVRVRYAPSPTGYLHIGNARTALFNYLFAKHYDGDFVIRIEDTDIARNLEDGESSQFSNLEWLGLNWDESVNKDGGYGPYRQSERGHIYKPLIDKLLAEDKAYKCYMTQEELEAEREEQIARGEMPRYGGKHAHLTLEEQKAFEAEGRQPSIRFRVPQNKTYTFNDIVKGEVSFDSNGIGDWVIVKKDGIPTYNFAVAIDDHYMEISHVIRGDDHISNTPKQLMIFEAFGFETPKFAHMTLIVNEERKKLSKRDGQILQFIEQYKDLGYLPEALFNFIGLLGWSPEGEEEIFSKEEFIKIFDEKRLSKSPAFFDKKKLEWINNQYMKEKDSETVFEMTIPHMVKAGLLPESPSEAELSWARDLVGLYQEQMSYAGEIVPLSELFFREHLDFSDEAKEVLNGEQVPTVMTELIKQFESLEPFDEPAEIKKSIKAVQKETGVKGKQLFMPIRVAVTGQTHGPELPNTIALLGRDKVLSRLKRII